MAKLTEKLKGVGTIIVRYGKDGVTSRELFDKNLEELKKLGIETFNSCNASASALKDLVVKTKKLYNDKLLTNYTATEKLIELLQEKEEK